MISRRQLLGCGVAVTTSAVACRLADDVESSAWPGPPAARPHIMIVDERFDEARRVASLVAPGVPHVALPRDVFELWNRQLESLCRSGRHAIAGVTTERGFFLLQTLAADHRLRVLSRATHAGSLVSWVLGPG